MADARQLLHMGAVPHLVLHLDTLEVDLGMQVLADKPSLVQQAVFQLQRSPQRSTFVQHMGALVKSSVHNPSLATAASNSMTLLAALGSLE